MVNGLLEVGKQTPYALSGRAVFGGPGALAAETRSPDGGVFLESSAAIEDFPIATDSDQLAGFLIVESAVALNPASPLSNILPGRDGLIIYKIQKGDTLSKIANNFDISLNTILWANQGFSGRLLQPGQEIVILPVSGVQHQVREGETIDSIARLYGVSKEKILKINPKTAVELKAGEKIIVPDARPQRSLALAAESNLPDLAGYFGLPARGWNWGGLHPVNAVDIANACGTPVYAAQEGLVTEIGNPANWNGGLGGFVLIEHPNRTSTRYAHTEKNLISVGDYVAKGEVVAQMGATGNVTGCHLHFEVRGARNPLAK